MHALIANNARVNVFLCSEVMVEEAVVCHFLIFGARLAIVCKGVDADASSGYKDACHLNVLGLHEADEVLHDDVDTVLVEAPMIPEAEEVEFEALALHHTFVREVADAYLSKVWLPCDGAECCELWAVEAHPVVILCVFVLKCFQHLGGVVLGYLGFLA